MSKVEKMSLKEIFNETNLILRQNDIIYFCEDMDVIGEFVEIAENTSNYKKIKEFLIENESVIDKEKLILLLIKNYQDNIRALQERKKELKYTLEEGNLNKGEDIKEFSQLNTQEFVQNANLKKAIKLAKGIETIIPFYTYDEEQNRYEVEVVDSRKIIDGKNISSLKNAKRFKEIDEYFKNKESREKFGIEYVLQSLVLTDFYEIFSDKKLGEFIRTMILENVVLQDGDKTATELENMKQLDYEEYTKIIDDSNFINMLPEVKKALEDNIQCVDIDKLLLISAYRFEEGLESDFLNDERAIAAKEIITAILQHIKVQNLKFSGILQKKDGKSYIDQEVEYSVKDLIKCISRFAGDKYISKNKIEEHITKIKNGEINLFQLGEEVINVICNQQDIENFALLNDENFKYALTRLQWDNKKIIEILEKRACSIETLRELFKNQQIDLKDILNLYLNEKLDITYIQQMHDIIDFSVDVNSYELIQYYKNSIELESTKEDKEKFDRYTELYKDTLSNINDQELLEEKNNELVNNLLDIYRGEEYIKVAEEFYNKGLVTLEVLAEWNGDKIIDAFYKDQIISFEDIEILAKSNKLSFEYISKIYKELISKPDIEYDERLSYIKTGYISEKEIFRLYESGLIFEKDLRDLAENGIVRIIETEKLINNRTKEDLEKNSSIKLTGLNELRKINNEIYLEEEDLPKIRERKEKEDKEDIPKLIIDPNKREEYINIFNAYKAETDLEEDSPFYNYEFYVIPDESGEIGLNSVVIAERYYEDKETEAKFALNNATYFFRYKDLMVLSNLKKSEMTKERENVVFTAKHTLADKNKNGYWAAGVIYAVAKTMLSSDLKQYTKTQQRKIVLDKFNQIYPEEKILEILDMASEIDSGDYTYEIVNPEDKILRKSVKSKKKDKTITINEDGLR